jgi:hypothetical protein
MERCLELGVYFFLPTKVCFLIKKPEYFHFQYKDNIDFVLTILPS